MTEYMSINDVKRAVKAAGYIVKDVSGDSSYGYDFAVFKAELVTEPVHYVKAVGEPLVESVTVYEPNTVNNAGEKGAYSAQFRRADIETLLNPAPVDAQRDGIYDRSEPASGHGMTMSVEVKNGVVVREWMHSHYVDFVPRNPDARWGHLGKSPVQLNTDGFRKRPAGEVWDGELTDDPNLW